MPKIVINRTGRHVALPNPENTHYSSASELAKFYEYDWINVLDYENHREIQWIGIDFNRLITRDGVLYAFRNWYGGYPFDGIDIEEIGYIIE